jgi:F0F1-type ATP synthase membrane subunit a
MAVRLTETDRVRKGASWVLGAVVLAHLAINIVHGQAHEGAQVPLSFAGTLFVYIVILAGPLVGLMLSVWRPVDGAWIVAATMAGALVFGLINHFIIAGPDHVDHVAAEWRTLFRTTAALLLVSEAVGVATAVWCATRMVRRAS